MHAAARQPAAAGDDGRLAEVNVDADGEEEDGEEGEVDDGVDEDGEAAGLEVAELDDPALSGDLEQQARRQQDEEHQRDEHRRPVLHLRSIPCFSLPSAPPPLLLSRRCCCCLAIYLFSTNNLYISLGSECVASQVTPRSPHICNCSPLTAHARPAR